MILNKIGFDVSFYQDDDRTLQQIDFVKMKNYGASFIIIKAGQWYYPDPDFEYNWRESKKAGLPRSAYWFCSKNSTGREQAQKFWSLVKNDPAEGMYFADYETGSWTDWRQLKEFLQEFQRLSGLPSGKIGIYTGYYYWFANSPVSASDLAFFSQFPLWIAWYASNPELVKIPRPWTEFLIWQSGTPAIGLQVGVESKEIDFNWFSGDDDKFRLFMGGEPNTVPPPSGDIMYNCSVLLTATPYINIRQTPNGDDVGDMLPGESFQADGIERDSQGRPWLHSIKPGKVGYVAAWLCTYEAVPVTGEKPVIKVTLEAEGYPTLVIDWTPND